MLEIQSNCVRVSLSKEKHVSESGRSIYEAQPNRSLIRLILTTSFRSCPEASETSPLPSFFTLSYSTFAWAFLNMFAIKLNSRLKNLSE